MINSANTVDLNLNSTTNSVFLTSTIVPLDKINMDGHHHHHTTKPAVVVTPNTNTTSATATICNWSFNGLTGITTVKAAKPYVHANANANMNVKKAHSRHITADTKDIVNVPFQAIETKKPHFNNNSSSNNNNYNNNHNNNNIFICKESALKIDELPRRSMAVGNLSPCHGNARERVVMGDDVKRRIPSDSTATTIKRTEYHENAYLRIEEVHNYAKLDGGCSYSNESSNSSMHEEEEEEEENDVDAEEEEYDEDITRNYARYVVNRNAQGGSIATMGYKSQIEEKEERRVNMRAVAQQEQQQLLQEQQPREGKQPEEVAPMPDHHARRPMNAFLIFCKRHRAIVKERYKSLENRAITKILGDWWASLDDNDKKCFTNLAQQNKDAFFSANPNFKWYKLPAPPLRTLNTRPSNAERTIEPQDYEEFNKMAAQNINTAGGASNYFKLADEAAMGGLNTLMNNNNNTTTNHSALQQALGETTQFLSAYMPQNANDINNSNGSLLGSKRRLHSEHSFSSNSSEEDAVPKKSSRSCKGKIYQELINSGQISALPKKLKTTKTINTTTTTTIPCSNGSIRSENTIHQGAFNEPKSGELPHHFLPQETGTQTSMTRSFQQHCELAHFDLEERIKELPALSLDLYLQRKRNTKKKKKFVTKKRNSNSASSNKSTSSVSTASTLSPTQTPPKSVPPPAAVGSQKRKARKESITRRDLSAIENEIASIIPLPTINGCYIFNEAPSPERLSGTTSLVVQAKEANANENGNDNAANVDNNISSTSDLLILAEVAANRTELTN